MPRKIKCPNGCDRGKIFYWGEEICGLCHGTGRDFKEDLYAGICQNCGGRGKKQKAPEICPRCGGHGFVYE